MLEPRFGGGRFLTHFGTRLLDFYKKRKEKKRKEMKNYIQAVKPLPTSIKEKKTHWPEEP